MASLNFDTIERDFTLLNVLFERIIDNMKDSSPLWEDLINKTAKFHNNLKSTLYASSAFLESFQKIADLATNTKGITKDIGTSLTRLCMRQKAIESKLRLFTNSLIESLVEPLTEKLEEWKKKVNLLEKEHSKEYKKFRVEFKKKSNDTIYLHKKLYKKTLNSKKLHSDELQYKYENSLHDVRDYCLLFEETEKQNLRFAMMEERDHFCTFFSFLKPVIDIEVTVLNEVVHLEDILNDLNKTTNEASISPHLTSIKIDQVIKDIKICPEFLQTIEQQKQQNDRLLINDKLDSQSSRSDSPESRKSSMCSMNSLTSCSSESSNPYNTHDIMLKKDLIENNKLIYRQSNGSVASATIKQGPLMVNQESSIYARHTLAGIPAVSKINNHKSRPALSIHTFDHDFDEEDENILRRQSSRISTTNADKLSLDLQPIDSLTSTSNEENSNLSLQSDDSNIIGCHMMLLNSNNHLRFNKNRSRTLPADKIAEGMKELIEKSNLKLNSPTKSTHSNDDTSSSQSIKSPSANSLTNTSKPQPPIRRNSSITTKTSPNKPSFSTNNDYEEIQLHRKRLDKIDEMTNATLSITPASLSLEKSRLKPTKDAIDYENLPPPPDSFYAEEINRR